MKTFGGLMWFKDNGIFVTPGGNAVSTIAYEIEVRPTTPTTDKTATLPRINYDFVYPAV